MDVILLFYSDTCKHCSDHLKWFQRLSAYLDTKTTAFKIVDLNNKDIIDLDVGNMFYWKKKDAIKYINNSNQLKLKNKRGI